MTAVWLLFRTLGLGYFRTHRLRTALSVVGVGLGVMLMLATLILDLSLTGSYGESRADLQGTAQLEVTGNGPAGLRAGVADTVRATPGVRASAALLVESARLRGPRGAVDVDAVGFDRDDLRRLAPPVTAARSVREVRYQAGLAVPQQLLDRLGKYGDATLVVSSGGRSIPLPVAAIVSPDLGAHLNGGRFVGLPLRIAQRVFEQPDRVTSVLVEADDGSPAALEALRRRLAGNLGPSVLVHPVVETERELARSTEVIQRYSTFAAVAALLIGAYLVFNTMSVAAVERRREASILLALGEPRQRLALRFLMEAGLLGAAGAAPGLAAGSLLGWELVGQVPRYLEDAYAFTPVASVSPVAIAIAGLAGTTMAVAAAVLPARGVLGTPAAEALRSQPAGESPIDGTLQAVALLAGLALTTLGVAGGLLQPADGAVFLLPVFAGFVLVAPACFAGATRLVAAALLRSRIALGGGLTRLAGMNLLHAPRRTVAMLSATAFSLALVVAVGGSLASLQELTARYADHYRRFDLYVAATDNAFALVPMDGAVLDTIRALPEVQAAYASRDTFVHWRAERVLLIGQDPAVLRRLGLPVSGNAAGRALAGLDGDGMLISTQIAATQHLGPGDSIELQTPSGVRSFRVAGIVEHLAWPDGTMIVGDRSYVSDFQQPGVNQVLIQLRDPARLPAVRAALRARLPDTAISTAGELVDGIHQQQSSALAPFVQVREVAVLVAVMTVLNTMLIAVIQRLRDLGIQRAVGITTTGVAAALVIEVAAVLSIALLAGIVLGSLMQALGTAFVAATTGLPLRWTFATGPVLQGVAAAIAAVLAGSLYPARRAAGVPVLDAIACE